MEQKVKETIIQQSISRRTRRKTSDQPQNIISTSSEKEKAPVQIPPKAHQLPQSPNSFLNRFPD